MEKSLRRVRDSQRIRVYRANSGVLGTPLPHMDDIQEFCEEVLDSSIWNALFPQDTPWKVPPLKPGRGARTAHVSWHYDGRVDIAFPKAYRYATYVLHELTHYGIGYRDDIAAHGPEFAGLWLTLVREFCSTRTSHALEKGLARERVRVFVPVFGELDMTEEEIELDLTDDDEDDDQYEINQLSLFN